MLKIVEHPIQDNFLYINNREYTWINGQRVLVGVENSDKTEIIKNEQTGLNHLRNSVEGQEIYNRPKRVHRSMYFLLDLETGSRGWYPGCEIHGDILGENVPLKASPDESSETLELISQATAKILDLNDIDDEPTTPGWYKIKYNHEGYIKETEISNIRYENPF